MAEPTEALNLAITRASANLTISLLDDATLIEQINLVCRSSNRAVVRLLMACALAKIDQPAVDIRKPYTQIDSDDTFSGRSYDEKYLDEFIHAHQLPCNPTTAFLTPALRNRNSTLVPGMQLEGRPKIAYDTALELLDAAHTNRITADDLLAEIIRQLLVYRNERQQQLAFQMSLLRDEGETIPLSSEGIVTLISQHLNSPRASRLPVLVVAAAYNAAQDFLGERVLPLQAHNAADSQTGALGDLEITLIDDDEVVTSYEMKMKRVSTVDIDNALHKISVVGRVDNYIFITTDVISEEVKTYAASIYDKTGGIEVVVLDCIDFLRHFLHLFHRLRMRFLDEYQTLVLAEPESAVRHELKTAFLALRQAAESGE